MKNLKRFNTKLFLAILITGLLPTIYTTIRFNFLGNLPSDWGFNIASQLQYVNLIFEVIQEGLILPLFFLIGKTLSNNEKTTNKIKTGLLFVFIIIFLFSLVLFIFAAPIVSNMAQNPNLINETVIYIRYELIGLIISNLVQFLMVIVISKEYKKEMYIILIVQLILTVFFDTLFISNLSVSLNTGVNGIAYTNIIVNLVMFIYLLRVIFKKYNINLKDYFANLDFSWLKEWKKVGGFSGIESLVRNLAFMIMILRMINVVGESGNYWTANTFIWSWLLLPILSLGQVVKKETSQGDENIAKKSKGYFIVTTIIVILWIALIPLYKPFLKNIMNITNYETVFNVVIIQLVFYIIFAYNNVMDSTFYGIGRTDYMLYQSLIVNIIFYGVAFILFKTNVFVPSLNKIALMFGLGMLFDFIPTSVLYIKMLRDRKVKFINE